MTRSQKSPTVATMVGGLGKYLGGRKSWRTQEGSHRSKLHMIMIFYPKCCIQSRRFDQRKQFNTFERTPSVLSTVCDKKQNKLSMFLVSTESNIINFPRLSEMKYSEPLNRLSSLSILLFFLFIFPCFTSQIAPGSKVQNIWFGL